MGESADPTAPLIPEVIFSCLLVIYEFLKKIGSGSLGTGMMIGRPSDGEADPLPTATVVPSEGEALPACGASGEGLAEGLMDAEGDIEGESDIPSEGDGLPDGDILALGEREAEGLTDDDSDPAEGEMLELGLIEALGDIVADAEALGLSDAEGLNDALCD